MLKSKISLSIFTPSTSISMLIFKNQYWNTLYSLLSRALPISFDAKTTKIKIEPVHDKTYKMACAPSEDSDQPGHLPSLIRVFTVHHEESLGPYLPTECTTKTLIRLGECPGWSVFTGGTCPFVSFVMHWLNYLLNIDPDLTVDQGLHCHSSDSF